MNNPNKSVLEVILIRLRRLITSITHTTNAITIEDLFRYELIWAGIKLAGSKATNIAKYIAQIGFFNNAKNKTTTIIPAKIYTGEK
jgi:hypothetical protein